MLLANYNSDSGSDSENESGPSRPPAKTPATTKPAAGPTASNTAKPAHVAATANLKPVKRKGPVKITLDLPKAGKGSKSDNDDSGKSDEEDVPDRDGGKKTAGGLKGKGTSALLGMLPPPKRKIQAPTPTVSRSASLAVNKSMAAKPRPPAGIADLSSSIRPGMNENRDHGEEDDDEGGKSGMLLPPSLARGKAKAKEDDALDLFGLSSATSGSNKAVSKSAKPPIDTISSAPLVPDFVPPEPSLSDPYPGYYQLPSGQWQAHDPEYYNSFFAAGDGKGDAGKSEDDGRIGRHWDDFNTKGANFVDVDVGEGLKRGREERERLEMTKKPKLPSDEFEYKPVGQIKGLATQRHQLSSLLNDAYSQKSELEDRIAQNRKNMRLAGQKYGF